MGGGERERDRGGVAMFHVEHARFHASSKIDGLPGKPRGGPRLEPAPAHAKVLDRFRQVSRRRFVRSSSWTLVPSDVHQAIQKCPGSDDQRPATEDRSILKRQPRNTAAIENNPASPADDPVNIWLGFERRTNPRRISRLVGLRPRRPHRRPAASVEKLELNACSVDCAAHQSAHRIDFSNQMSHGGITGHVRDGFSTERAQTHAPPQARRRPRRLDTGMPGADDDYI